jgi:hypothetical protein
MALRIFGLGLKKAFHIEVSHDRGGKSITDLAFGTILAGCVVLNTLLTIAARLTVTRPASISLTLLARSTNSFISTFLGREAVSSIAAGTVA